MSPLREVNLKGQRAQVRREGVGQYVLDFVDINTKYLITSDGIETFIKNGVVIEEVDPEEMGNDEEE